MRTPGKRPSKKVGKKPSAHRKAGARPKKAGGPAKKRAPKKPAAASGAAGRAAPAENPKAKALAEQMAQLVLDKKATDVVIFDVRGMTSYADYVVLASGESERQVAAMAENVLAKLREQG